jgi:hypothetical protein
VLPFFEVTFGADRYDSRTMGAGELAAFYLWWSLGRAAEGSIVLIEEPECYLSPGSQDAFRDYAASMAFTRKLCIVMTSHSAQIIAPLSKESTRFFRRDAQGIKLVSDRPAPILLETLGIRPSVDTIVFVEDAAGTFCRLWLERLDPNLSRRIEIIVRNGEVLGEEDRRRPRSVARARRPGPSASMRCGMPASGSRGLRARCARKAFAAS